MHTFSQTNTHRQTHTQRQTNKHSTFKRKESYKNIQHTHDIHTKDNINLKIVFVSFFSVCFFFYLGYKMLVLGVCSGYLLARYKGTDWLVGWLVLVVMFIVTFKMILYSKLLKIHLPLGIKKCTMHKHNYTHILTLIYWYKQTQLHAQRHLYQKNHIWKKMLEKI